MSHRIFICDGTKPDNEVIQEAIDWVAEDKENRTATIEGKGNGTTNLESYRARVEFCQDSEFTTKGEEHEREE